MLLVSRFSRVRLCAASWTAAYQVPRPWDFPGKSEWVAIAFSICMMKDLLLYFKANRYLSLFIKNFIGVYLVYSVVKQTP